MLSSCSYCNKYSNWDLPHIITFLFSKRKKAMLYNTIDLEIYFGVWGILPSFPQIGRNCQCSNALSCSKKATSCGIQSDDLWCRSPMLNLLIYPDIVCLRYYDLSSCPANIVNSPTCQRHMLYSKQVWACLGEGRCICMVMPWGGMGCPCMWGRG